MAVGVIWFPDVDKQTYDAVREKVVPVRSGERAAVPCGRRRRWSLVHIRALAITSGARAVHDGSS
jgi:hypothetical protein